jgi:hypothetical protein
MQTSTWDLGLMIQEKNHHPVAADLHAVSPEPDIEGILGKLERLVVQFERLIENRSRESLQQPGEDGRWGVVEVVCHMRDWETILHDRVGRILEDECPVLDNPDTTMWPLEHNYRGQDSHTVFRDLASRRRELIERLREVEPTAWERTAIVEPMGEISLRELLDQAIAHDDRYLQEAREAVA